MNILYVVNADIEKPAFGNAQRTRLMYDALCKVGNVYVLNARELQLSPQTGIKKLVNAVWQRLVINTCGKCLIPVYPFPLRWSIETLFPGIRFDMVVARYLYYVGRLSLWSISPRLYVDIDDHPRQVFETIYSVKYNLIRKIWSRFINGLFCKFVLRKLTGSWIANPNQVEMVSPYCSCIALKNVPFILSNKKGEKSILKAKMVEHSLNEEFVFTVGAMGYPPNYLGVDSFLKNIWPVVRSKYPNLKYKIVGKGTPHQFLETWGAIPNIEALGYVEDISELYHDCMASVVPVQSGGGTCIKTLESMSHSKICLSTPFGARGLPEGILKDGSVGVVVYNSAEEFVSALDRISTDKCWREKSEQAASDYIEENFSREKFEKTVIELITRSHH